MHLAKHTFTFQVHHWSILQISAYPPKVEKFILSYWHPFVLDQSNKLYSNKLVFDILLPLLVVLYFLSSQMTCRYLATIFCLFY